MTLNVKIFLKLPTIFAAMNRIYLFSFALALFLQASCANRNNQELVEINPLEGKEIKRTKMTVEIWSDVVCPFCYIGKRKFESALQQFEHRDHVEIVWKSYQLNPDQKTEPSKNAIQSLAESKGISVQEAKSMAQYVTNMAKTVGLTYDFEKAVTVNTRNAHRFTHLAKSEGKQIEAEELLFQAYFVQGKNIDDVAVLQELGKSIGLNPERVAAVYNSNEFNEAVERDIYESRQIGVQGVPFFVFDNKFGVSGAQDEAVFLKTLEKAFEEKKM